MPNIRKRKKLEEGALAAEPPNPESKSSKVTFLSPSLILLEIPADTNTSLPVWDAVRSQQVDVAWNVNPYSVGVHLTPLTSGRVSPASTQTQSTSSGAQTPMAPSSKILQSQMVIQSQSSCVLLTLSANSAQLLQNTPGNPVNSHVISLPLIITQPQPAHQPCTSTKKPAIQTPMATPTKPSEGPGPSSFHTKLSDDVQICDDFLLRFCEAGRECKMHHTPYPFHWQLWCVSTHLWVDVPSHAQVLLERRYCDVRQDDVCIKDGPLCYNLVFDQMELNRSYKYDAVRRLTNSDSWVNNLYFPSKWHIYWWNNLDWEEYNKDVSTLLLKKMREKKNGCSFYMRLQEYEVDFTTMIQTNVTTGFTRNIRCRPVYRSPESMRPHLQTGILTKPEPEPPGGYFSVDPLQEFISWYPPAWCLDSEQDYSLVDLPVGTQAYRCVQSLFCESLPETGVDIVSIQQVQNLLHWDKYQRQKAYMQKQHMKSKEPLERHLFHGTSKESSEDICHNNFDPRVAGLNGASNGYGSYFATTSSFSHTYAHKSGPDEVRHMFLAKVLVGKVSQGKTRYRRPPPLKSKTAQFHLYDTCVDNIDKPSMFVVFDSCQCYPYYLIKYKDLPEEIDI